MPRKIHIRWVLILIFIFSAIHSKAVLGQNADKNRDNPGQLETVPLQKRMFIMSKTYSAINNFFVHWQDVPELKLDDLYQTYLEKAIKTENRYDFDLLMMEFINNLQNGHSWFRDKWLARTYGQPLDFDFRFLEGKWIVTKSANPNIKPGELLEKIDGQNFEDFYQAKKKYADPTSDRTCRTSFSSPRFVFLFPRSFTLELDGGKSVKIIRNAAAPPASPSSIVTGKWIDPDRSAYIKIETFNDPDANEKAFQYVTQFKNAESLIIDVRGYSGGNTPEKIIDALMDRPYRFFAESTNVNFGLFQFYSQFYERLRGQFPESDIAYMKTLSDYFEHSSLVWTPKYQQPKQPLYKNKLILVMDGGSVSAKEDFLMPFKDNKRAVLVGERTAGSSGQPFMYNFDADMNLAIGTKRLYMPDGSAFEKTGIVPDVESVPTIQDIKAGRDTILEKAVLIAREK